MRTVDTNNKISLPELQEMAGNMFGDLVKAVVDVKQNAMVVDAELPADEEALLLENGFSQFNLWGINLYPDLKGNDFVEFDSMINMRPSTGNRSRGVEDHEIRDAILKLVDLLVIR